MAWVYLLLAAMCEMAWPVGFKYTHGFTKNFPLIVVTGALLCISFLLMMLATRDPRMHVGTAYAVWTGLGATGTALLGIMLFHEPREWQRLACLGLIIVGVMGLKLFSPAEEKSPVEPVVKRDISR